MEEDNMYRIFTGQMDSENQAITKILSYQIFY